jgi:hypothetical protein
MQLSLSGVFLPEVFVAEKILTLRGQSRAPFRASPLEYETSRFGCHARAKPVGSRPFQVTWLERAFH